MTESTLMPWLLIVLLAYMAAMLLNILHAIDEVRENKDNHPLVTAMRQDPAIRAIAALTLIPLSLLWPLSVATAFARWYVRVHHRLDED